MTQLKKMVLVIQDLTSKEGETIAILSGDVHYVSENEEAYEDLKKRIDEEKDEQKRTALEIEEKEFVKIASFQLALDSNPDLRRHMAALAEEAIVLREEKDKKGK